MSVSRVAAWLIVVLYFAGMGAATLLERAGLRQDTSPEDMVVLVGFGAFAVVGALLVVKRPTNNPPPIAKSPSKSAGSRSPSSSGPSL